MNYSRGTDESQKGIVSIITVVLFAIILSVLSIGFLRVMLDEQQQTLGDDLAKSAYNSAQGGIEDAKRAIRYCSTLTGFTKQTCETALYRSGCPGFNSTGGTYFSGIGIPTAASAKTRVGNTDLNQGYSCVIVSRNSDTLNGSLSLNTSSSSDMVELRLDPLTSAGLTYLKIEWHEAVANGAAPTLRLQGPYTNNGNPRQTDWGTSPAVLRTTIISQNVDSNISPTTNLSLRSTFIYPTVDALAGTANSWPLAGGSGRHMARCDTTKDFVCTAYIALTAGPRYYLALETLYSSTNYRISALNSAGAIIQFQDIEPVIDSTGYTNNVYRRVQAHVRSGSVPLVISSALDASEGLCKDFRVSPNATDYVDNC